MAAEEIEVAGENAIEAPGPIAADGVPKERVDTLGARVVARLVRGLRVRRSDGKRATPMTVKVDSSRP